MSSKKVRLTTLIRVLIIVSLLILSGIIMIFHTVSVRRSTVKQVNELKKEYVVEEKEIQKNTILGISDLVEHRITSINDVIKIRNNHRINEAYSIAENLYNEYRDSKSEVELKKIIIDALRPVRFRHKTGYYFIINDDEELVLFDQSREHEGRKIVDYNKDFGDQVISEIRRVLANNVEGEISYSWTKPGVSGLYLKVSYIKYFAPYDWYLGTGLYVNDIAGEVKSELLTEINDIYISDDSSIYILDENGDVLIAEGHRYNEPIKIWDLEESSIKRSRADFKKELEAAFQSGGGYVDFGESDSRIVFSYGSRESGWIIGSGINMDVIQKEIDRMQKISWENSFTTIYQTILITILIASLVSMLFLFLTRNMMHDFNLFIDFFSAASNKGVEIDTDKIRYREVDNIAVSANKMLRDVNQSRDRLKESENKFRLLAENSGDMIVKYLINESRLEYISPATLKITGYSSEELLEKGFDIYSLVHPDWIDFINEKTKSAVNGNIDDLMEYQIIHKDGYPIWIEQRNTLVKEPDSGDISIVARLSNNTERKLIEEQLRHSYRMDVIGQISSGIAHDFNNIISGIMSASQVLKSPKRELDEKSYKMVDLIVSSAERASILTKKLSNFGRKRTVVLNPADANMIIDDTVASFNQTLDGNITLVVNRSAVNTTINADVVELQSALLNLLINASHAVGEGGNITLEITDCSIEKGYNRYSSDLKQGEYLRIEVRDNGCGIEESALDKIFDPFFSTKEFGVGTGLGLSSVYGAMMDHNGVVTVESEVGHGTSFFLFFPVSRVNKKEEISQSPKPNIGIGILVVDDEEVIRETNRSILENSGYEVFTAENGEDALKIYGREQEKIELVIMDLNMPVMDGREAFYKLKELDENVKVIFSTGFIPNDCNVDELKEIGIKGIIKKPFKIDEFLAYIESFFRK